MSSIILQHVDFNYDAPYNDVFTDLSLVMDTSWRTGLVGRNGQGKSTLLNLLARHSEPSAGSLELSEQTLYFPMSVDQSLNTVDAILDAIAPFRYWEGRMEELLADGSERALIEYSEIQELYVVSPFGTTDTKFQETLFRMVSSVYPASSCLSHAEDA